MLQLFCGTGNWNDKKWSVLLQPLRLCCREEGEKKGEEVEKVEEEVEEEKEEEEGGDMTGRLGCRTALVELSSEAGVVVVVSRLKQLE